MMDNATPHIKQLSEHVLDKLRPELERLANSDRPEVRNYVYLMRHRYPELDRTSRCEDEG